MTERPNLRGLVRRAATRLGAAGVVSSDHDARALAAYVLGVEPATLVTHATVTAEQAERFEELVRRREQRVPLQHLTGIAYFRRLALHVGPGVFVPRPETEVVVQAAIDEVVRLEAGGTPAPSVVDLCAGSGAIAASIAVEVPGSRVVAVEISPEAASWAARNLAGLAVDLRVADATTACHDLDGSVDVVVSNPPYIPPRAVIRDPEVAAHDPAVALWGGGEDGLDIVRGVVRRAAGLLREGGLLVVEHADIQGEALVGLVTATGDFADVADHRDLTGRDRFTTARRAGTSGPGVTPSTAAGAGSSA